MLERICILVAMVVIYHTFAPTADVLAKSLGDLPAASDAARTACEGDLELSERMARLHPDDAASLHIRGALSLLLRCDIDAAVDFHLKAKGLDATVIPPLAQLHLNGDLCGGMGDIFYVMAVITKQLVDGRQSEATSDNFSRAPAVSNPSADESNTINNYYYYPREQIVSSLSNLLTIASDSGLHRSAEAIYEGLTRVDPNNTAILIRGALLTPGVYENSKHINETRVRLQGRLDQLFELCCESVDGNSDGSNHRQLQPLKTLDEFVLSPTFYFVYQGYDSDQHLLSKLHSVYAFAYPTLADVHPSLQLKQQQQQQQQQPQQQQPLQTNTDSSHIHPIRIGFVSSHFRRHSICKLFCGIISGLAQQKSDSDQNIFKVFVFSSLPQQHEDEQTRKLIQSQNIYFIRTGMTVVGNREEVTNRDIDVLVYLDVGMVPSTVVWASARLAPIQVCVWGHPTTTGLKHMDYFMSSQYFHFSEQQRRKLLSLESNGYTEQLVQFTDSLGYYFQRAHLSAFDQIILGNNKDMNDKDVNIQPLLSYLTERPEPYYETIYSILKQQSSSSGAAGTSESDLKELMRLASLRTHHNTHQQSKESISIVLCPQLLTKFHPKFDIVIRKILNELPFAVLVLVHNSNKKLAWKNILMNRWRRSIGVRNLQRIVWLNSLKPEEYLSLVALGDIMIDPFPFGGGVTTLEALSMCTPVVTAPTLQTVPALTAGMILTMSQAASASTAAPANASSAISQLISASAEGMADTVVRLLRSDVKQRKLGDSEERRPSELDIVRSALCQQTPAVFNQEPSVAEWSEFVQNAVIGQLQQ